MKMIKPSFTLNPIPEATDRDGVLMYLERIGRVCYKSEDKITTGSALKFLENIRNRKHWAMLEHYIFTVSIPEWMYNSLIEYENEILEDPNYIMKKKFITRTCWKTAPSSKYKYLISFSATSLNYLIACESMVNANHDAVSKLFKFMHSRYPELMMDPNPLIERYEDDRIQFLSREEIKNLPMWLRKIHDFMSVTFVVDRGVTHEIVRHRPFSYAQESTRYCNYSNGKFDNEITVIIPSFFDTGMGENSNSLIFTEWKHSCESSEHHYMKLLEMGATPQQARSVLPNSLKAEIVMTGSLYNFTHFFNMRCDTAAHPQMREVACPLLIEANTINDQYKGTFDEQMHWVENYDKGE